MYIQGLLGCMFIALERLVKFPLVPCDGFPWCLYLALRLSFVSANSHPENVGDFQPKSGQCAWEMLNHLWINLKTFIEEKIVAMLNLFETIGFQLKWLFYRRHSSFCMIHFGTSQHIISETKAFWGPRGPALKIKHSVQHISHQFVKATQKSSSIFPTKSLLSLSPVPSNSGFSLPRSKLSILILARSPQGHHQNPISTHFPIPSWKSTIVQDH